MPVSAVPQIQREDTRVWVWVGLWWIRLSVDLKTYFVLQHEFPILVDRRGFRVDVTVHHRDRSRDVASIRFR